MYVYDDDDDAGGSEDEEDSERSAHWVPSAVCMRGGIHQRCHRVLSAQLTARSLVSVYLLASVQSEYIDKKGKGFVSFVGEIR